MAEQPEPPLCDICDCKDDVDFFCKNCEDMLCSICSTIHSKTPSSKNDEIISLSQAKKDGLTHGVKIPVIFCEKHSSEAVSMYCLSCEVFICTECLTGRHFNHSMTTVKEITKVKLQELTEIKSVLKSKQQMYKHAFETEKKVHKEYNQSLDRIRQEITDQKNKVISELDNICEDQLEELLALLKKENRRYTDSCLHLQTNKLVLSSALDRVLQGIESDDLTGMRNAKKDATSILQELKDQPKPEEPVAAPESESVLKQDSGE